MSMLGETLWKEGASMHYDCLIVDDEIVLADRTAEYFNLFDVTSKAVYSAAQCRSFLLSNSASMILLDINLGDGSGFALCQELRATMELPILFISARTSVDDQIIALHIGGDDYIQKPYSLSVLLAKVKVVLKRYGQNSGYLYQDERLKVDLHARKVWVNHKEIKLRTLEFKLLVYLIAHKDRLVSKQELFQEIWEDRYTQDGTLNVHIRKLREAIEVDPGQPQYIITQWKEGYRFQGTSQ